MDYIFLICPLSILTSRILFWNIVLGKECSLYKIKMLLGISLVVKPVLIFKGESWK